MATEHILRLYDEGIAACLARDAPRAVEVVMALIAALNFEYREAAGRFFALYDFCLDNLEARRFDRPLRVLRALKEAWTPSAVPPCQPIS